MRALVWWILDVVSVFVCVGVCVSNFDFIDKTHACLHTEHTDIIYHIHTLPRTIVYNIKYSKRKAQAQWLDFLVYSVLKQRRRYCTKRSCIWLMNAMSEDSEKSAQMYCAPFREFRSKSQVMHTQTKHAHSWDDAVVCVSCVVPHVHTPYVLADMVQNIHKHNERLACRGRGETKSIKLNAYKLFEHHPPSSGYSYVTHMWLFWKHIRLCCVHV